MSKNSSLDLSTSCDFELLVKQCCGIYELIHLSCAVLSRKKQQNIYLPQVLHKAARKRVFETRFLYIEKKKKRNNKYQLSKNQLSTGSATSTVIHISEFKHHKMKIKNSINTSKANEPWDI